MSQTDQNVSILITDDDTRNRLDLLAMVRTFIHYAHIQEAINGEEATRMVEEKIATTGESFDLIFMDFQMPGKNGEETTSAIRKIENKMGIKKKSIIITWSSAKASPYAEADDWMVKPVERQELKRLLMLYEFVAQT